MTALPPVPADSDWFPVRITSIPAAGQYVFQEVWLSGDLIVADRVGGRVNTTNDRAYPIDGSTFTVAAVGSSVQAMARRAVGAGGIAWELKGFGGTLTSGSEPLPADYVVGGGVENTGLTFTPPSDGSYLICVETCIAYTGATPGGVAAQFRLINGAGYTLDTTWDIPAIGASSVGWSTISKAFLHHPDTALAIPLTLWVNKATAATCTVRKGPTGVLNTRILWIKLV